MIRLRISRPRLSVPIGWVQLGGWRRSASATVSGSYGANTPAQAALRMSARRITADTTPSGFRLASKSPWESQRATSLCRWWRVSLAARGGTTGDLLIADSGVKPRIGNVHQHIYDDQDHREKQDVGLYLRIIPKSNRREHQKADAWQGKEGLQNDRPPQERAQLGPQNGDHRDHRILQRMLIHHEGFPQALGARCPNVVLAQHLQHGRPDHARGGRGEPQSQHQHGQEKLLEVPQRVAEQRGIAQRWERTKQ